MKHFLTLIFFVLVNAYAFSQKTDSVTISGYVTDFNNNPLDSVTVKLMNKSFEDQYVTISDQAGYYEIIVAKGEYYCLYALKISEWLKTRLEYWTWNVPAYNNMVINPKYNRLEIYGMNAFEPQIGPFDTYMVFFRPMSLTKILEYTNRTNKQNFEKNANLHKDTIDIAPNMITKEDLRVSINDCESEVVGINKVIEYTRGSYMYSYLIQIKKPAGLINSHNEYDKISIMLNSNETNEQGFSECFVKKIK